MRKALKKFCKVFAAAAVAALWAASSSAQGPITVEQFRLERKGHYSGAAVTSVKNTSDQTLCIALVSIDPYVSSGEYVGIVFKVLEDVEFPLREKTPQAPTGYNVIVLPSGGAREFHTNYEFYKDMLADEVPKLSDVFDPVEFGQLNERIAARQFGFKITVAYYECAGIPEAEAAVDRQVDAIDLGWVSSARERVFYFKTQIMRVP